MKKFINQSLFLTAVSFVALQNEGKAVDFGNNFYGKMNVFVMGKYQTNKIKDDMGDEGDKKKYGGAYSGVGVDVFYKLNDEVNPFVGVSANAGSLFKISGNDDYKFNQFLNVNFRAGLSFKANKDVKINPYGFVGFNVSQVKMGAPNNNDVNNEAEEYWNAREVGITENAEEGYRLYQIEQWKQYVASRIKGVVLNDDGTDSLTRFEVGGKVYVEKWTGAFGPSSFEVQGFDYISNTPFENEDGSHYTAQYLNLNNINELKQYVGDNYDEKFLVQTGSNFAYINVPDSATLWNNWENNGFGIDIEEIDKSLEVGRDSSETISVAQFNQRFESYYNEVAGSGAGNAGGNTNNNANNENNNNNNVNDNTNNNANNENNNNNNVNENNNAENGNAVENDIDMISQKKTKIGLNAGAGIDVVIKDRFTVGAEYQYSDLKVFGAKLKSHSIGVKFGVEFL